MERQEMRHCPVCGSDRPASDVDKATELRADILQLRQQLEDVERDNPAGGTSPQARAELQERIDRRLQDLSGGYGADDEEH